MDDKENRFWDAPCMDLYGCLEGDSNAVTEYNDLGWPADGHVSVVSFPDGYGTIYSCAFEKCYRANERTNLSAHQFFRKSKRAPFSFIRTFE